MAEYSKNNPGNNPRGVNRTRGRDRLITTPEMLLQYAEQYCDHVDKNPILSHDVFKSGNNAGESFYVKKQRPYTMQGFSVYLVDHGVIGAPRTLLDYWYNLNGTAYAYVDVVDYIKDKMFAQKFEGAAAGIFNPAIIAADLKLKTQTEHTEKTINTEVDVSQLSTSALEEIERIAAANRRG